MLLWVSGPTDAVTLAPITAKPQDPPSLTVFVMHGPSGGAGNEPMDPIATAQTTVTEDTPARAFGLTISLVGVEEDADGKGGYYVLEIDPPRGAPWH